MVWPLFVYRPTKFNFYALSLGSIIADFECLVLFLLTGESLGARLVMHSILGAVTINLLIVVISVIYIVPSILNYLDRKVKNKRIFQFAQVDLREHKTSVVVIIYSGLIGTVSHVLIDLLHHPYNPLTFPFEQYYTFNLILFNDLFIANVLVNGVTGALLIIMLYYWYFKNLL